MALATSMSTTTATNAAEGLLALDSSCVAAAETSEESGEVDASVQITSDASVQTDHSSFNSDASVQTDMSFILVSSVTKSYLKYIRLAFCVDWKVSSTPAMKQSVNSMRRFCVLQHLPTE